MAYPEPLEFNDRALYSTGFSECSLSTGAIQSFLVLAVNGETVCLTPTTRDTMIDWLVAQREAERAENKP